MYNEKQIVALRYFFLGKQYFKAARSLEFCIDMHPNLRKDGVTPYYLHPVAVCSYVATLSSSLIFPERTLSVALLHDILEDTAVSPKELAEVVLGDLDIVQDVMLFSKNYSIESDYFPNIARSAAASVVKGADNVNNIQSMVGVFTADKQVQYVYRTKDKILPCLKVARRNFPEQQFAYENIKLVLNSQTALIEKMLGDSFVVQA